MWQQSRQTPMEGNVTESEEFKCKEQHDSGHVDSGFLSSGNIQLSSELSGSELDLESTPSAVLTPTLPLRPSSRASTATTAITSVSGVVSETSASSSTATATATTTTTTKTKTTTKTTTTSLSSRSPLSPPSSVAREQMRADSGVDLGLSESLSQLTLKQVTLNPLSGSANKVQVEPTVELTPVSKRNPITVGDVKVDDIVKSDEQQRQEHRKRSIDTDGSLRDRHTFTEEPWQLYYTQDDDGDTQLHIAIVQGFLEAAFSLIRMAPHPCLLDILNDEGQSPLHLAVLTRQPRIVRRLILAGANPSLRNIRGNTGLHLTCATGDIACAKALTDPLSPLERNYLLSGKKMPALPQNLEQRNYDGEMCLHIAAAGDEVELVRLLLRLGADLEAREGLSGKTALHLALERGCRSVVAFLLQECRPCLDTPTYAGITAYQIALCFDRQLARELVRLGATAEPLPESESDGGGTDDEDSDGESSAFLASNALARMRQNVVGVRV